MGASRPQWGHIRSLTLGSRQRRTLTYRLASPSPRCRAPPRGRASPALPWGGGYPMRAAPAAGLACAGSGCGGYMDLAGEAAPRRHRSPGNGSVPRLDSCVAPDSKDAMVDKQKKIWLDGEFIDWDEAKVHVLTHSLHYGLAPFDGMRAYQRSDGGTYVFRLREHVERLFDSCKMCLLQPKFTREQIERVCI